MLRGGSLVGLGQTVNLSSSGALLRVQHSISLWEPVEIAVEPPILIGHNLFIQFVAEGRVVRIESGCIAIQFDRHEFRTSKPAPAS